MKHYSPKEINEIKQQVRTGKPAAIIADELAKEWKRPVAGLYAKVLTLSKQTRKVKSTYKGPLRKPFIRKKIEEVTPKEPQVVIQEICEEIIEKPFERQPAEIGIEVPVNIMSFTGTPKKVVIYSDHVRYYFNN